MANLKGLTDQLDSYLDSTGVQSAQQEFDENYITTAEIMERVGVSRASVLRKLKTRYPSIKAMGSTFWRRTVEIEAFVNMWSQDKE